MKVAVLLSGGVDSSVAALLLKEQGHKVIGLTMINWDENIVKKARTAAESLGIECQFIDLRREFEEKVIDYFCQSYSRGETPNPCVVCNQTIKFGVLLDAAREMGFDMVASGHYARILYDHEKARYLLKKGLDSSKDQSYFLYSLSQDQLSSIIFPLGEMTKNQVKDLARQHGMEAAENPESQEICFVTDDYRDFIEDRILCDPGEVLDIEGRVLGRHRGIAFYTTGQRKGLGISAGHPVYVVGKNLEHNRLILGNEQLLYSKKLLSVNNNMIFCDKLNTPLEVTAKIRYRTAEAPAAIYPNGDGIRVEFEQAQRAITPGQSVVFYLGEYVLGGGVIS
ncbi:MAG: tRNA 2-thiouridine(34) synthase MnmA [Syntrophomonadaceae bacterium]|nr:tRNA 2-thiouridine(34) synthase MnmA [Syntrophomonadaceae bacterium]